MHSAKPKNPSKLDYFQLSREHNKEWLFTPKYRNLLWYREQYEVIKKFDKFDETLIKIKQGGDDCHLK